MRHCNFNLNNIIQLLLFLSVATVGATTIVIPTQQPNIQAGIDIAANGDTVLVLPGTYSGDGNRDIDFLGKELVVRSEKGATSTVIDCGGSSTSPHRGFRFHSGENSKALLEGFTIRGGFAPADGPDSTAVGGGILFDSGSSPTIMNCVIENNYAEIAGGGVFCLALSNPTFLGCRFDSNQADNDFFAPVATFGGAIRSYFSCPVFIACTLSNNVAAIGGAISCRESYVSLIDCVIKQNTAIVLAGFETVSRGHGGGVHLYKSQLTVDGCVFSGNRAQHLNGLTYEGGWGGAIICASSSLIISNSTFYGNVAESFDSIAPGRGGGIFLIESSLKAENTIIAFSSDGEAVYCIDTISSSMLSCCDIFGNAGGDWVSCIAGQNGQAGNFSADPLFCDATAADFSLKNISQCAPANSPCGELVGAFDANCVSTHISPETTASLPEEYNLKQNYPNPFNPETRIEFSLPKSSFVKLDIYNILGERITTLVSEQLSAGHWSTTWDGTHSNGSKVASGIYFYRIETDSFVKSKKMLLLK